ncbi:Ig-like domain-containing protein [Rhodococcus marinonascens]|uniref:Ig-like domain-containing protein n=1 Tax=Rhodococcus marinonascens TaxID=38311 RepID=UPI000933C7B3|nr:Ig-like domain-containing protein [Rhodococcus marinonascens]
MSGRNIRRIVGVLGAAAVAAGFVVAAGVGVAGAADSSVTWTDGNARFTRSFSNIKPSAGDDITVSTKFEWFKGSVFESEFIYDIWDVHPECLTFKSATVDGKPYDIHTQDADFVRVSNNTNAWSVTPPSGSNRSRTFAFTYQVGTNCNRNVPLTTGMRYLSSRSSGGNINAYSDVGPDVTVRLDTSSTALDTVSSGVQVGQSVPLTATVTGGAAGDAVEFYDGPAKLGTALLDGTGVAAFGWIPDAVGRHGLSAKYLGNPQTESSQSSLQTVQVSLDAEPGTTGSVGNLFGS